MHRLAACPYEARTFNFGDNTTYFPELDETNPYEAAHEGAFKTGTVTKCIFCADRVDEGAALPACAQACPTHARIFGDMETPEMQQHLVGGAYVSRPDQRTDPNVYYLPR